MEVKKETVSGSENKGDVKINIKPGKNGLEINVSSMLGESFYKQIAESTESIINKYSIINAVIDIMDNGALDYVIKARMESVLLEASVEIEKKIYFEKINLHYKPRRTFLFVPGNEPIGMQKIESNGADAVVFDLEDSVLIDKKNDARKLVSHALKSINFKNSEKMVKINSLDICGDEDIEELMHSGINAIIIPKCLTEHDVKKVLEIVEKQERKNSSFNGKVMLIPMIETARGVNNAYSIASSTDRVLGIMFDGHDYSSSIGINNSYKENELIYARNVVLNASKSAGIQAFDYYFSDDSDLEKLKKQTIMLKNIGFDGRCITNPDNIKVIHNIFKYNENEIEEAEKVLKAYEKFKHEGGALKLNERVLDASEIMKSLKILEMSEAEKREMIDGE